MSDKILNAKILHVAKTTSQWSSEQSVIPKGMLCVEFADAGTKIKIGDGVKNFSALPYVDSTDLSEYFTKTETEAAIASAIGAIGNVLKLKGTAESVSALPTAGNNPGDLWFVNSESLEGDIYSEYVWLQSGKWEFIGRTAPKVDLSEYATKTYVESSLSSFKSESDNRYICDSDYVVINCTL